MAVPAGGYEFSQWSGDLSGSANPGSIVMDAPKTVTATFVPSSERYNIALEVAAAGFGTVSLNPIQPPEGYLVNQGITLTAAANTGYVFYRWAGDLTGNTNPASIVADDNKTITAVFNATMTVISEPVDTGTVTLDPAQPADGYAAGTAVMLKATATKGYRFDHWSGDLTGSSSSAAVTVDSAKEITANFVKKAPFPWWWIVVGIVLLFPVLVIARIAYAAIISAWTARNRL